MDVSWAAAKDGVGQAEFAAEATGRFSVDAAWGSRYPSLHKTPGVFGGLVRTALILKRKYSSLYFSGDNFNLVSSFK